MENMVRQLNLVAKDILAEEYPYGMNERAKEGYAKLLEGISRKQVWNAEYKEWKSYTLGRNFERVIEEKSSAMPFLYQFENLYGASLDSFVTLTNLKNKLIKFRKALKNADGDEFYNYILAHQYGTDFEKLRNDPRILEIRDNWNQVVARVEDFVKKLETWIPVADAFEEAKKYIVMGRKPIERPEGYVPRIYVPPMAGASAVALVQKLLREIVANQRGGLIGRMTMRDIGSLSQYPTDLEYRDAYKWFKDHGLEYYFSKVIENPSGPMFGVRTMKSDYEAIVEKMVTRSVDEMIESYVYKNTQKIASIISVKGEPSRTAVSWGDIQGWGFAGEIIFEFNDVTGFTVRNKAVWKSTEWGSNFVQFPTTFHNVIFPDGKKQSMVPEKEMNEVWAKAQKVVEASMKEASGEGKIIGVQESEGTIGDAVVNKDILDGQIAEDILKIAKDLKA